MPTTRSKSNTQIKESDHAGDKREHKDADGQDEKPDAKSVKVDSKQKAGRRRSSVSKKATEKEPPETKKQTRSLEKGHIYFFYRPKADSGDEVESEDDVQKLYMVLKPHWSTDKRKPTLIILGRKKLPEVDDHARYWGFVAAADDDVSQLTSAFKESTYETKTRGTRKVHAARPAAEGVYMITAHNGHSHLAYITTAPREPGKVQEAFNIDKESSLIISIKASNPKTSNADGAGLRGRQKATYPDDLQECFSDQRFIAMENTKFLNYTNSELLLIGATDNLIQELGEVAEELHQLEEEDELKVLDVGDVKYIFDELKLDKGKAPVEPLHGEWK
ncbi:hypothetical protein INT44_005257 [Umbelopsis vinacea]|uniref:Uncharacterized protein n=1 Tax=Umbelopsis vinacea TaxID=44442 RepID=A0A8H7UPS4_9FUNG|nr:hypothetical protein INT44_005257 [Umbelopsis vinacea]